MELRHLRYFLAVVDEGHITRAADRLGIQQPPLSRLIKSMERELGAQLFKRTPRGVELTDAGSSFDERARAVLAGLDEALELARSTARGQRGHIRLGATATTSLHPFVSSTIRGFRQAFPQVAVSLKEDLSAQLMSDVRQGRVDAAFLWTPPGEGLLVDRILEDELLVALPAHHPLVNTGRDGQAIALKALANETFVIYGRKDGFGLYAATIVACRAAGFRPRFGEEASRLGAALGLVAVGLGVFFVPSAIERVQMEGVVYRRFKGSVRPKTMLGLVSRSGPTSSLVRNFRSFAKECPLRAQSGPKRASRLRQRINNVTDED